MLLSAAIIIAIDWNAFWICMQPWPVVDNICIHSSLLICYLVLSSASTANASTFLSAVPSSGFEVNAM